MPDAPLLRFALRRAAVGVLLVVVVSAIVFAATEVLPGDAARAILGRTATPAAVEELSSQLELHRPPNRRAPSPSSGS